MQTETQPNQPQNKLLTEMALLSAIAQFEVNVQQLDTINNTFRTQTISLFLASTTPFIDLLQCIEQLNTSVTVIKEVFNAINENEGVYYNSKNQDIELDLNQCELLSGVITDMDAIINSTTMPELTSRVLVFNSYVRDLKTAFNL